MFHLSSNYTFEDVYQLATAQAKMIDSLKGNTELKIVDSDMIVYEVWFQERFQQLPNNWSDLMELGRVDFHLLCKPDIPWESDALRENALDRDRLYESYLKVLHKHNFTFEMIEGNKKVRLSRCVQSIEKKKATR